MEYSYQKYQPNMFIDIPSRKIFIKGGQLRNRKSYFYLSCELDGRNIEITLFVAKPNQDICLELEFSIAIDKLHGAIDIQKLAKTIAKHDDDEDSKDIFATSLLVDRVLSLTFKVTDDGIESATLAIASGKPKTNPILIKGDESDFNGDWKDFFKIEKQTRR